MIFTTAFKSLINNQRIATVIIWKVNKKMYDNNRTENVMINNNEEKFFNRHQDQE